jgi:coenzyme F420-reducing hydrogenase beta subunit
MDMNSITHAQEEQVIEQHLLISRNGFKALKKVTEFCCCGCGLCVSVCPERLLYMDDTTKKPALAGECTSCGYCYLACPRSFLPLSKIDQRYFGNGTNEEQQRLGNYRDLCVARSLTENIYQQGTPGGTTTALVHYMMEKNYVDAALLTKGKHPEIRYCMHPLPYIAQAPEDVLLSSHSKFEISPLLALLGDLSPYQKALFVGTPCHIIAFRKLQIISSDQLLRNKVPELACIADHLIKPVKFAISINCFLNHTSMDKAYKWLNICEEDLIRFNENVSKSLYDKAFAEGKDWRWFFRNNYVTKDGREQDYDVNQLGVLVLPSGCLLCNNLIVSKQADASIGFYGAETGLKEVGWNTVAIMNEELKKIVDEMVASGKLARKPMLRGFGRILRKVLEKCLPAMDVMGTEQYLKTGLWSYPKTLRLAKGPRKTYILGLELLFLGQTIRRKLFYEGTLKKLKKAGAYIPTVY